MANVTYLVAAFGAPRTKRLLLADLIEADEALSCGFLLTIVPAEALDSAIAALCARLLSHAPITMRVSKEAVRRIVADDHPRGDDLIQEA